MSRSVLLLLVLWAGCAQHPVEGDLLAGKAPLRASGVTHPELLTDGIAASDGGMWDSPLAAAFQDLRSEAVWDLGERRDLRAVWLQADANDRYEVSVSDDGVAFTPIWTASDGPPHGLMPRYETLSTAGRYLRVRPASGDGAYSATELMVFATEPQPFPPLVPRKGAAPPDRSLRDAILLFALSILAVVVLCAKEATLGWMLVVAAWPVWQAVQLGMAMSEVPGVYGDREVGLARGAVAFVAAALVLWEIYAPRRFAPRRVLTLGALGLCGALGVLAFYHLGQPQFFDRQGDRPTFVHLLDLRQYANTVRYFPELGYFGEYEADVAAYAQDTHRSLDSLASLPMRDLHTNFMTTAGALRANIAAIPGRFTPERWKAYREDAAWMRATMGESAWLETLGDLGANATPVWMALASAILRPFPASHGLYAFAALLDPLLFLLLFVSVLRAFGPRTAAAVMVIFGANDFIMYGSNWAGAPLRHDWLVYIGLGACALKSGRFALGGALLALSASIRAFPAFALLGAGVPAAIATWETYKQKNRWPTYREILAAHPGPVRMLAAAALTALVLFALSSAVMGPGAWVAWVQKASLLGTDAHPNPVCLRTVIAGSGGDRYLVLASRSPLFVGAVCAFIVLVLLAARGKKPEQGAMLGMMLVPILMSPANYYAHFVCLLPLLAVEREDGFSASDGWLTATLLLMCAVQYFTLMTDELRTHFWLSSVTLVVAFAAVLAILVRRDAWSILEGPPALQPTPRS